VEVSESIFVFAYSERLVSAARNDDLVEAKMYSDPFQSHLGVRFTAANSHNETEGIEQWKSKAEQWIQRLR
ncbi:hypothetical protein LINPERHAP1_LOCUS19239, partial [Linum perenne]